METEIKSVSVVSASCQSNRAVEQQSSRKIQLQKLFLYLLLYWAAGLLLLSHCSLEVL